MFLSIDNGPTALKSISSDALTLKIREVRGILAFKQVHNTKILHTDKVSASNSNGFFYAIYDETYT